MTKAELMTKPLSEIIDMALAYTNFLHRWSAEGEPGQRIRGYYPGARGQRGWFQARVTAPGFVGNLSFHAWLRAKRIARYLALHPQPDAHETMWMRANPGHSREQYATRRLEGNINRHHNVQLNCGGQWIAVGSLRQNPAPSSGWARFA